jgi:hypothetical protein
VKARQIEKKDMATVDLESGQTMRPTNYFLDHFVAHKLSSLTHCGACELPPESAWLNTFILNSAFKARLEPKQRAYAFNVIRRTLGAFVAYRQARAELDEYISTGRNVFTPYFRALLNFEISLAQCYQGYELVMTAKGEGFYTKGDGSALQRLNALYRDSKHMDERIENGQLPETATAALWITNTGLESTQASLSFVELGELLMQLGDIAQTLSGLGMQPAGDEPQ